MLTPTPGRALDRRRPLRLLDAPRNLRLAPYTGGTPRRLVDAPVALRALELVHILCAEDLGDVPAAPYRDAPLVLGRLLAHPRAVAPQVTIYDPSLAPDGSCGRRLVALLAVSLGAGGAAADSRP